MRLAIVGGGVAGLGAARALRARFPQAELALFEAEGRLGGKVGTHRADGFTAERGPTAVSGAPALRRIVEEAGRSLEVVVAPPKASRWVWLKERLRKAPSAGLLSPLAMARLALEPLFAERNPDDRTLRQFFTSHLGAEAGGLAAQVVANGVWAGDPDALSARAALPRFVAVSDRHRSLLVGMLRREKQPGPSGLWSLRTGLGALVESLLPKVAIKLASPIEGMAPSGAGWELEDQGHFDGVVLALPAHAAAELVRPFSGPVAKGLASIAYAPVTVVHLGVKIEEIDRCDGFGMLDGDGTLRILGTLFPSSLFPDRAPLGHALLTTIVGGARAPERAALPDDALLPLVHEELARTLGLRGAPVWTHVVRHARAIPQPTVGHLDRIRALRALLAPLPPLALAGAAYDGASISDAHHGGEQAAEVLARRLG